MTSGQFKAYPINSITINRTDRQRRELPARHVTELANSMAEIGLINPIIITPDGALVAGECRLSAARQLGWTSIPAQLTSDLSPDELHLIELEENVKRRNLDWKDECEAITRYHELRTTREHSWLLSQTAEALSKSLPEVSSRLTVCEELRKGNARVTAADKYSTARGIIERERSRAKDSFTLIPTQTSKDEPEFTFEPDEEDTYISAYVEPLTPFMNTDFVTWARDYTGAPFNLIHCDFPYGINADKFDQGAAPAFGGYADTLDTYKELIITLQLHMKTIVAESAHLIFWFSMHHYEMTRAALTAAGWNVNPVPLIWHKSDNTGVLPDPARGPRRTYETAFFASLGGRKIVTPVANSFSWPAEKATRLHMSAKPVSMLTHFFRMVVDQHSHVLDPTCGSGNAIIAAESLGAARTLGLEIDPEHHANAVRSYNEAGKE